MISRLIAAQSLFHPPAIRTMASSSRAQLTNVLSKSKSPYLLQHKDNPVAWQEFTPETIALAKELDRPIFLSSGYSACHWCHVLAHESFEDQETARIMNEHFVNIKVDREERPDVDRMYMTYLQATQGGGGWPLSVFMTPGLEPFFAGTYFPNARFKNLLGRIQELWEEDRESCEKMGREVVGMLKEMGSGSSGRLPGTLDQILSTAPAQKVFSHLAKTHDPRYGGFAPGGRATRGPKFPSVSMTLEPLARLSAYAPPGEGPDVRDEARSMAIKMIRAIWTGGIRDQVGNGVARYSVDEKWIVPHFEKMLYDQAQLVTSAIDFALLSGSTSAEDVDTPRRDGDRKICFDLAADILEYTMRDLYSPEGGFLSAEDADSAPAPGAKKAEGAFYIWDKAEMDKILGEHAEVVEFFYGVKVAGNVDPVHDAHGEMTGKNILYQAKSYGETAQRFSLDEAEVRRTVREGSAALKTHRDKTRERPGLDDKILTAWNGLMASLRLSALARAGASLPDEYAIKARCLPAAEKVVTFIKDKMWDAPSKTLYRSWREGRGPQAQTDDYAFLIRGLLDLYEATGQESHLLFAVELQERQGELFWDAAGGGYFASAPDEHVLVRMKDSQDGAEPSTTSVSVHNLSRLSLLVSNEYEKYEKRAEETYLSIAAELKQVPRAFAYCVSGLMDLEKGYRELVITGSADDQLTVALLKLVNGVYMPNKVVIRIDPAHPPQGLAELNEKVKSLLSESKASLRICEGGTCGLPITDLTEAERAIRSDA